MRGYSKIVAAIGCILFFFGTFFVTSQERIETDLYWHLKAGEIVNKHGITYQDHVSQAGTERTWYPYEWSYQLALFHFVRIFGIDSVRFLTGVIITTQILFLFVFLKRIMGLQWYYAIILCLSYILLNVSYFTPRPQIVSKLLFMGVFFILHAYSVTGKPKLFWTLPLLYIWSTFHASLFLGPVLFGLYASVSWASWMVSKESVRKQRAKTISIWGVIATIVSLLPPTGLLQYQYMWFYAMNREVYLSIHEGLPVYYFLPDLLFYLFLIASVIIPCLILMWKFTTNKLLTSISFIPQLFFIAFGFIALRSMEYGFLAIILMMGWIIVHLPRRSAIQWVMIGLGVWLVPQIFSAYSQMQIAAQHLPEQAATFLQTSLSPQPLFNMYPSGGYFSYKLHPQYKIFIDGRTDVYVCCELKDYMNLQRAAKDSQSLSPFFQQFFDEYQFNTAIVTYRNDPFGEALLKQLNNNLSWNLVFWDDSDAIFVRAPKTHAATPFSEKPFMKGAEPQAIEEYLKMDTMYPSALSKGNIGLLFALQGENDKARTYLQDAIETDKHYHFGYFNLGLLSLQDGNRDEAQKWFTKALETAPAAQQQLYTDRMNQLSF